MVRVATNADMVYAVTADHEVLVWGGSGAGSTGIHVDADDEWAKEMYMEPQFVTELQGEEATSCSVGASHAAVCTSGGDVFVWGHNLAGQLGLTDFQKRPLPTILTYFETDDDIRVRQMECGENHCCCLTTAGAVYSWGHVDSGRLGLGVKERFGARAEEKLYFPAPTVVSGLSAEPIIEVSCGAAHTLALSEEGKVFSWGLGAGGRLGLGDFHSRIEPYEVTALSNKCVMQVAAATWHSAAVVCVPPMQGSGWVYTWGSGYHGQLAHGRTQVQTTPTVVEALRSRNLSAVSIRLGSHHSAMIAMDGELYTWGSNLHGCLGHAIRDQFVEHTADPGHVWVWGHCGKGGSRHGPRLRARAGVYDRRDVSVRRTHGGRRAEAHGGGGDPTRYVGAGGRAGRRHPPRLAGGDAGRRHARDGRGRHDHGRRVHHERRRRPRRAGGHFGQGHGRPEE